MSDNTNASEYNGWKNYPTWAVNLWLSNDEGLYNETRNTADSFARTGVFDSNVPEIWTAAEASRFRFAERLKEWVTDDLAPDLGASFAADLLGYALGQVDWDEIANAWLAEVEA